MKERYVQRAIQLSGQGYNCAQAVACTFTDILDIDEQTLFKLSEGLGRGMGGMDGTCGALSGAILVLSLLNSSGDIKHPTKEKTYVQVKEIFDRFVKEIGSSVCRDIKGVDSGFALYPCADCIQDAVRYTYEHLQIPLRGVL